MKAEKVTDPITRTTILPTTHAKFLRQRSIDPRSADKLPRRVPWRSPVRIDRRADDRRRSGPGSCGTIFAYRSCREPSKGSACNTVQTQSGIHPPIAVEGHRESDQQRSDLRRSRKLLVPGRNCWRIERARRVSWLIDGEEYFSAVRAALVRAHHSIFIVGWDIDSRMHLVAGDASDGFPRQLGDLLTALVAARAQLNVHILSWDYAFLFALEREWLTEQRLGAGNQGRLKFQLDDRHPTGASHHQKLVVVDDAVSFVSGLDLTRNRWDTRAHAAHDDRRRNADGEAYAPFHDVGVIADGGVARALGELARTRWLGATGRKLRPATIPAQSDCWPDHVDADLCDIDVGIARTEPRFEGDQGVYEIRTLHLEVIESARDSLFAENQYFTSRTISEAIELRLRQGNAPEVVVVAPSTQSGWLESSTMGVLRARIHASLTHADTQQRYRLYCPWIVGAEDRQSCLTVHSKILIADDEFVTIGSANLSGRSMGLDTECNLAIEANGDPVIARSIARLRARLLAEHLDCGEADVEAALRSHRGKLIPAIESLRHEGRSLVPLMSTPAQDWTALVPDHSLLDPEEPIDPEALMGDLVSRRDKRPVALRTVGIAILLAALAALALLWHYTPLRELVSPEKLADFAERFAGNAWSPLLVMAAYLVAGLMVSARNRHGCGDGHCLWAGTRFCVRAGR